MFVDGKEFGRYNLNDNSILCAEKNDRQAHLRNARQMAVESMVLLKNENKALPLKKSDKIALIGPYTKERRSLLGSWTIDGRAEETPNLFEETVKKVRGQGNVYINSDLTDIFDNSVATVTRSDVVVLALGERWSVTGENRSVSDISISETQKSLIKKVKALGKKTVGVFFCGRPIAMQGIAEYFDAILYAWHSGSETVGAACDILFGDAVPSGKLPVTVPRLATHIPLYYNCFSSGRPVNGYYGENPQENYTESLATPYYPFGYGLSYTNFEYGEIICNKTEISLEDIRNNAGFEFSVVVANTGGYSGFETVQLYIRDIAAKKYASAEGT